ncbi:aminopeptidase, partial [bacterium]|nr:aminopeptidase [bacterium]
DVKLMSNILVYADGEYDLLDMANKLNISMHEMLQSIGILVEEGLLKEIVY